MHALYNLRSPTPCPVGAGHDPRHQHARAGQTVRVLLGCLAAPQQAPPDAHAARRDPDGPRSRATLIWRLYGGRKAKRFYRSWLRSARGCKATSNKRLNSATHGLPSWPRPASPPTLSLLPSCSANRFSGTRRPTQASCSHPTTFASGISSRVLLAGNSQSPCHVTGRSCYSNQSH
jgi:hypothetical protein